MTVSYMQRVREELRLVILRLLADAPGYTSNSSVLDAMLDDYGLRVTRDQVDTELQWLSEQGLVGLERIATVFRATLNTRGLDVARGDAHVPGVKRPGPGGLANGPQKLD